MSNIREVQNLSINYYDVIMIFLNNQVCIIHLIDEYIDIENFHCDICTVVTLKDINVYKHEYYSVVYSRLIGINNHGGIRKYIKI